MSLQICFVNKYSLQDLSHWVAGWVDWNIVLDESGGPNYANNTVDSPVIVNTTSKMGNNHGF